MFNYSFDAAKQVRGFEELKQLVLLPFATTQQKTAGEIRQFYFFTIRKSNYYFP